jgi:hypothetical protein
MLDALEGAERTARVSEERTRRFVADAAHELRTPMAGVRAAAEAVVAEADPERRERLAVLLVRESERASHLVDDLLDLARIDAGLTLRSEPVDLRALASTRLERVRLVAPSVDVELTGDPVWVMGDADRLTQVPANLIDNARRAMDARARSRSRAPRGSGAGADHRLRRARGGPGADLRPPGLPGRLPRAPHRRHHPRRRRPGPRHRPRHCPSPQRQPAVPPRPDHNRGAAFELTLP